MALPVSPNPISFNNVNQELGRQSPYNQTVALNDGVVRTLFQRTTAGSSVAMSDGWGKSNVTAPALVGYTGFTSSANRTIWSTHDFSMYDWNYNGAGGYTIGFTVTGGGTITYEWQFLTWYGWQGNCSPIAASSISWSSPDGSAYNDTISGANTNVVSFTNVYAYESTSTYRGIQGYWRLAASNSAGTIYSGWFELRKQWGEYTYDCNCYCPGNNYEYCCTCNCDENNENCTGCCGYNCCYNGFVCDTCYGYYNFSAGNNAANYWCS